MKPFILFVFIFLIISGCNNDEGNNEINDFFLEKIGGDLQTGNPYQTLSIPIYVRVVNASKIPRPDISVLFEVAQGNGSLAVDKIKTDNNGLAQVLWTLGGPDLPQELIVRAFRNDGRSVQNSPQIFTASFDALCLNTTLDVDVITGSTLVESVVTGGTPPYSFLWSTGQTTSTVELLASGEYHLVVTDGDGCSKMINFEFFPGCAETSELMDVDGNVYPVVVIGNQCWTAENLRTTKYDNGDPIVHITENLDWMQADTGAYSWYANDNANHETYGKLYNWTAVMDERKLCPAGWHVPTDEDWTELGVSLGGQLVAGGKLKATGLDYWSIPNSNATNESGFSALPASFRDSDGNFYDLGRYGVWWTSTQLNSNSAWLRMVYYNAPNINKFGYNKKNGLAVRCVRD